MTTTPYFLKRAVAINYEMLHNFFYCFHVLTDYLKGRYYEFSYNII